MATTVRAAGHTRTCPMWRNPFKTVTPAMAAACARCAHLIGPKGARAARLDARIVEQRLWIAECGQTRAGYVARYGSERDAEHYGDGGEAIYAADVAYLARLIEERQTLV